MACAQMKKEDKVRHPDNREVAAATPRWPVRALDCACDDELWFSPGPAIVIRVADGY